MIYTECYNDCELLNFIGLKYKIDYDHSYSKKNVLNAMKGSTISLGIIDEDPNSVIKYPEMDYFEIIESRNGLAIYRHKYNSNHHLLEFQGELEDWLISIAIRLGLPIGQFEIMRANRKFKKRFRTSHEKNHFWQFLDAISEHQSFQIFRTWLDKYA